MFTYPNIHQNKKGAYRYYQILSPAKPFYSFKCLSPAYEFYIDTNRPFDNQYAF